MCNRYIKEERKNGAKETFEEIMAKNFSKIIELSNHRSKKLRDQYTD